MNTAELDGQIMVEGKDTIVHLPSGLLGFEQIKKYILLSKLEDAPFHWLQAIEDRSLTFLVVSPFDVMPRYAPDIPAEDVSSIGLEDPSDALFFNIVTLRPKGRSTVNLKGPIVLNRYSLIGKQVVLSNASEYSVQHPLPYSE